MVEPIGLVETAISHAQQLYDRYETIKANRALCEKLQKGFGKVEEKLRELQHSTSTWPAAEGWTSKVSKLISPAEYLEHAQAPTVSPAMPKGWVDNLDELISYFSEATNTLKALSDKSKSKFKAFLRAREWKRELEELMNDFENLNSKTWLLDNFGIMIQEIRKLGAPSTSQDVEFVPSFHVPENPSGVIVNFNDPGTMESALKHKVLNAFSTVVGAAAVKGTSAVVVTGMGGVGKTSALRAIGADKEVQDQYTGGVYFFTLGQNATSAEVINMVAAAVQKTKGVQEAKEISSQQNVRSAIGRAANRFVGKRCLFICDDLWRTESKPNSYLYDFKALVPSGSKSCILFSTRDLKVAEEIDVENQVHFSTRSDNEAAAMLRQYAGFRDNETYSSDSFQFVLKLCRGLPIALAVAGRAVQRIARTSRERNLAWDKYEKRLQEAGGEALCIEAAGDHEGLFQALTASLEEASKLAEFQNIGHGIPLQVTYRAFCVLRKQAWAPSSMLACLWGTEEIKAEKTAEQMELLSLVSIEHREFNRKSVLGVKLHDLVHDFCLKRARENKEVTMWHARLLDGYISRSKLSKEYFEKEFESHNWWSPRLEDDKYVHVHLTYHLAQSRRLEELESLMLNFRWTCRQLKVNRFLTLEEDFQLLSTYERNKIPETGSEHAPSLDQYDKEPNDNWSSSKNPSKESERDQNSGNVPGQIDLIIVALRFSWPRVVSHKLVFSERELAFQMMGRLCSLRESMSAVDKYLSGVEREAERPWASPLGPCLELPRGPAYGMFQMPDCVHAVSMIHGTDLAVAGDSDGNLSIFNIKSMETLRSWRGHEGGLTSLAVSEDGRWVVLGLYEGTVRIWNMKTGEAVGDPLRGHEDVVTSVAVGEDGRRIVSGSRDRTVRIWDMETGDPFGEPLRGHEDAVTSVKVSRDGRRIVSGSWDKTVRIWNMETGEVIGEPLRGHKSRITSVVVSRDGCRIVSGSWDRTVRIWNMERGEAVGKPLLGHESRITSVKASGDGGRIVSGSRDRTVRIWDMETGEAVGEPLRGHKNWITSVAVSADGGWIVSGSLDRTVRIWDIKTGEVAGDPLPHHRSRITSVAVTGDGRRMVSGSWDRTVRIWDMETGEAIGGPLRRHKAKIKAVGVSKDVRRIVSGSGDKTVQIWDMETREAIGEPLRGHEEVVTSVVVSGDGRRIVSGSGDKTLRIWDMETREAIGKPLRGHEDVVTSVAVSKDGRRIVSGSRDKTVRIWDMETREAVGEPLRGHEEAVRSVAVSRDGRRIVSGSADGMVRIWDMETGEAVGDPLERHETSVALVATSGLIEDFIRRDPRSDAGRSEMHAARNLSSWTFCIEGHDGIFYGDIARGTDAMKIGSFDFRVSAWLLDTVGKLWVGLWNGTLAVVRTMK